MNIKKLFTNEASNLFFLLEKLSKYLRSWWFFICLSFLLHFYMKILESVLVLISWLTFCFIYIIQQLQNTEAFYKIK